MKALWPLGILVFVGYGIVQIVAASAGLSYYIGTFWTFVAFSLALILRFTLPITIGAFLGAFKIWGWHWFFAAVFTAPGLILVIPGALASVLAAIKVRSR